MAALEGGFGPVLLKVPCTQGCTALYVSHTYLAKPWPELPGLESLVFLCALGRLRSSPRRPRRHVCRLAEETSIAPEKDDAEVTASWLPKLRRVCSVRNHEVIARIALSLKDDEAAQQLVTALAQECLRHSVYFFRCLLREFRWQYVPSHLAVALFQSVEPWFRAQCPDLAAWNEVVHTYITDHRDEEAWGLLLSMEEAADPRLPAPDISTYTLLIPSVVRSQGCVAAAQLWSRSASRGLREDPLLHLTLAVAFADASPPRLDLVKAHVRRGERLLQQTMASPYPHTEKPLEKSPLYATLMSAYRRLGRLRDCFTVLGVMQRRSVQLDGVVFAILQQACWGHDDATAEVRQLLRLMETLTVQPTTINYNALVRTYTDTGQFTNALQVANRMKEAGIRWDQFTYKYLLDASVNAGQLELAVKLLSSMRSDGARPRDKHYISVFLGLAKAGFYEDAARVFERLSTRSVAGPQAWNLMMGIHCYRGDMDAALEMLERMRAANAGPDVMSFRVLLEGFLGMGDWAGALGLQEPLTNLRRGLAQVAQDPQATELAREVATKELERKVQWVKAYNLLIEACVGTGEWMRGVDLLKEVVEAGFPVDVVKHARLLSDMKQTYAGDEPLDISPQVGGPLAERGTHDLMLERELSWMASVPNVQRFQQHKATLADKVGDIDRVPLHALTAAISPHWLDGSPSTLSTMDRCRQLLDAPEDEESQSVDAAATHEILYAYFHATVHRRAVVPLCLAPRQELIARAEPETLQSLRQLFEDHGWPGSGSPVYVFLRPASSLAALLVLLALASECPHLLLLRPVGPAEDLKALKALARECQARSNRALAVALSATLKNLPRAALVNSRTLIANAADFQESCDHFERSIRDAMAGRKEPDEWEEEGLEDARKKDPGAWISWLRRQKLQRLLRHDGSSLHVDSTSHRPGVLKVQSFRLVGRPNGQDELVT